MTRGSHIQITEIASTLAGVNPIGKTRRYSQATKKYVSIDQPHCTSLYNTYIGGVARMDENIAKLRIEIRGKRVEPLDLLAFTRRISLTYVYKYNCRPIQLKLPQDNRMTPEVRVDKEGHFILKK
uniref:Uncharacterized protein n=1 Tax=Timema genevievae TaxID=629358 RepID=A0A7R9K8T4_TIMGE|nr:unnamed protein product [Timema genevievae]